LKRTVATVLYWLATITITLGAYGHGFQGIKGVEGPIVTSALPPDVVGVIWIVWYWVSGSMLVFGILLIWAWPALKRGPGSRSGVALVIGAFYAITGVACYLYSGRDPFWLLFLFQGICLIASTVMLHQSSGQRLQR
jgi:hypothetical protein